MKTPLPFPLCLVLLLLFSSPTQAAIPLNVTQTFDTWPAAGDWSTTNSGSSSSAFADVLTFDAMVQTNEARNITNRLVEVTGSSTYGAARWNSTGGYVYTRPTGVAAAILMATLENTSGANLSGLFVNYDLSTPNALDGEDTELAGHRAFFSLTGASNSWVPIPEFTTFTPGALLATLNLGSWPAGAPLYILWGDDNGAPGTDGSFAIDNFRAGMCLPAPVIIYQPQSPNVLQGRTVQLTVQIGSECGGVAPGLVYQWYKNGIAIDPANNPSAATSTLVITNAQFTDTGDYFVTASNVAGGVTSQNAHLDVLCDCAPPRLVAAQIVPSLTSNIFLLHVDEKLCLDLMSCGGDARSPFDWEIRDSETQEDLELSWVEVNGTNISFQTNIPWQLGRSYRIVVSPNGFGVFDPFGNAIPVGSFVETLPTSIFVATQDAEIHSNAQADTPLGAATAVTVDGDDAGVAQGLLRFENLFGFSASQIPLGALIRSARLSLSQSDPGDTATLHRMLVPWDEGTVTWNSLVDGVSTNGTEATIYPDALTPNNVPNGSINLDVLSSVQAWANGQINYGWMFQSTGTGGLDWETSESANPPVLVVTWEPGDQCNAAITFQPPATIVVNEGAPFSIAVGVSNAFSATFQWSKDGVDIPGATSTSFSVASAQVGCSGGGDEGVYRLRVTCPGSLSITSNPTVVTIPQDRVRPQLTGASAVNETNVVLIFSKSLDTNSAQTLTNYTFNPPLEVRGASYSNRTVTLLTAPRTALVSYILSVANVTDDRACVNLLAINPTHVNLTAVREEMPWQSEWLYSTNNQDATLNGTPWFAPGFVPAAGWHTGMALFGTETSATIVPLFPVPIGTVILPNTGLPPDQITTYFRRQIELAPLPAGAQYVLCHFIDDGAVFYLDGVEIARVNMTNVPPVLYSHRASTAGEAALLSVPFSATAGTHTLAVEVHQGGTTTSSDVLFGARIVALGTQPELNIVRQTGRVELQWAADSSWQLIGAENPVGVFTTIPAPLGRYTIPATNLINPTFYRLRYTGRP